MPQEYDGRGRTVTGATLGAAKGPRLQPEGGRVVWIGDDKGRGAERRPHATTTDRRRKGASPQG